MAKQNGATIFKVASLHLLCGLVKTSYVLGIFESLFISNIL